MDGLLIQKPRIAFVTPEAFISPLAHLPAGRIYSGGLGVLTDAMACAAHDLGIELDVWTILPRFGYYKQGVENGRMTVSFEPNHLDGIEKEDCGFVTVSICGKPVHAQIWRIPGEPLRTCNHYLLDTDVTANDWLGRVNTHYLYGGPRCSQGGPGTFEESWARKVAQAMVLGFGAHAGAKHLKLQYDIWQGNDCHCVFAFLALLKEAMEGGMGLNAAVKYVKCQSAFTTHTAVEAGNYAADLGLLMHLLQDPTLSEQLLATVGYGKTPGVFSFTAACFNLSGVANAVSKKHRLISQDLWSSCIDVSHLTHVTNGTNLRYWQHQDFIRANTPREVRDAKKAHAMALRAYVLGKTDTSLAENAPTIVWARRFAEYKRPGLLPFMAHEWFEQRLKESAFIYIVAGKPHPDDEHMIRVWNELSAMSRTLPNFVVLEDYDMPRSKLLKCGADVWLNTPRAPNEACGTSGMSGNFNGAMHVSTPDGWAAEANPDNCFLFGGDSGDDPSECLQDRFDIGQLVPTLERTLHEHGTDAWWTRVLRAKKETQLMFSSERMVQDYRYRVWEPLLNKSDRLQTAVFAA